MIKRGQLIITLNQAQVEVLPHHQFENIPSNIWNLYILGISLLQYNVSIC